MAGAGHAEPGFVGIQAEGRQSTSPDATRIQRPDTGRPVPAQLRPMAEDDIQAGTGAAWYLEPRDQIIVAAEGPTIGAQMQATGRITEPNPRQAVHRIAKARGAGKVR